MRKSISPQIVVGLSGGIDSAVALLLLKKQGWSPVGLSLRLPVWEGSRNSPTENPYCTEESLRLAQQICQQLKVPYFIQDARQKFSQIVVAYFLQEIKHHRTPNPCMICNRYFKIKELLHWAKQHQINYVATGHYARIKYNPKTAQYELFRARDKSKDQTYNLALLTQRQLRHLIFPLGNLYKKDVYKLAQQQGWKKLILKRQSQDFCFVSGKSLPNFLSQNIPSTPGPIINSEGKIIGKHQGLPLYTIGQRKGLNLPQGPFYVREFLPSQNTLIVTKNIKDLYHQKIVVYPYHLISGDILKKSMKVRIKIRAQQKLTQGVIKPIGRTKIEVQFSKPVLSPTPGQFAVFYQKDKCLGGGVIKLIL